MTMQPPLRAEEAERLAAVRALGRLDRADATLNDVAAQAAALFAAPCALVTLIEADRLVFVGQYGARCSETPRGQAICPYMIDSRGPMIVPDTLADERYRHHPLVTNAPHLRFYAGVPLFSNGQCVGALCVIDLAPRAAIESGDLVRLERLANIALRLIEVQKLRASLSTARQEKVVAETRAVRAVEEAASAFAACDRLALNLGGRFHDALARMQAHAVSGQSHSGLSIAEETAALVDLADELAAVARLEMPTTGGALFQPSEILEAVVADWTAATRELRLAMQVRDLTRGVEMLGDALRFEELLGNLLVDLTPLAEGCGLDLELRLEPRRDSARALLSLSLAAKDHRKANNASSWRLSARNRVLIGSMAGGWEVSSVERRITVTLPARLCGVAPATRAGAQGDNVVQFEGFKDVRRHER